MRVLIDRLPRPSYIFNTLTAYASRYPGAERFFVLGLEDFSHMHLWYRGAELPSLAAMAVIPREELGTVDFRSAVHLHWPGCREVHPPGRSQAAFALPQGGRVLLLNLPRLDISASLIRRRWLAGQSIRFLTPDPVPAVLERHRPAVTAAWRIAERAPGLTAAGVHGGCPRGKAST